MNLRRIVALAIAGLALIAYGTTTRADTAPVAPFRIVMVGDSIGTLIYPLVVGPDIYWDAEPGRSPYDVGGENRSSTVDALGVLTQLMTPYTSAKPTWVVVQEGATGTMTGRYITGAEWQNFIRDVVRLTAGRCLLFVYPGYGHTINGVPSETGNDIAYTRTIMARDIFDQYPARCIRTVNWWWAADQNPGYLQADGLHPSAAGVAWLVTQINAILPNA